MTPEELQKRTKVFALRVIRLVSALPNNTIGRRLGGQLFDSASSIGANYRAARRARSRKEFVSKLCIVVEEADETAYWLELIVEAQLLPAQKVESLLQEAGELTRIFAVMRKSTISDRKPNKNSLIQRNHQIAISQNHQIEEQRKIVVLHPHHA